MARVQRITYFVANLEDKPGAFLKVMQDLKAQNIGLAGSWGFGISEGRAQLFAVAKNPDKLRNAWRASGLLAEQGTGFFIKGADRTGALLKPLEALSAAYINIRAIHAIAVGGRYGSFFWVDAPNVERAAEALGAK